MSFDGQAGTFPHPPVAAGVPPLSGPVPGGARAGPVTTSRYTGRINGFYRLENRRDTAREATAEMVDALRAGLA